MSKPANTANPHKLPAVLELNRLFAYDPLTGILTWRPRAGEDRMTKVWNSHYAGKPAGALRDNGYLRVHISALTGPQRFYVHRIIFKMMTGNDPVAEIDHRDGDRLNNKWVNLREATRGENCRNVSKQHNNKTGLKGISWYSQRQKWRVKIYRDGKQLHIGHFDNFTDAASAMKKARAELHGNFAREA